MSEDGEGEKPGEERSGALFGRTLAELRRRGRLSQLALAQATTVSQRHISFLETGRARPGPAVVARLARVLCVTHAETNALHEAAGLTAPRPSVDWGDPAFAPARAVVEALLRRHAPCPAVVIDRAGTVLALNRGAEAVLTWMFGGVDPWERVGRGGGRSYWDLALHPEGLGQALQNPGEVVPHLLRRLRAAARHDAQAARVLARVGRYPLARRFDSTAETAPAALCSVVAERYAVAGETLGLISMTAGFGSPEDVTAQAVQVELFHPDGPGSAALLERLAASC